MVAASCVVGEGACLKAQNGGNDQHSGNWEGLDPPGQGLGSHEAGQRQEPTAMG